MESKTIKVSEENYRWLLTVAATLQKDRGRRISFDEAIENMKTGRTNARNLLKLAGSWKMTEREADKIKKETRKGWNAWKIQSV